MYKARVFFAILELFEIKILTIMKIDININRSFEYLRE
jgi:hypothetical protein